MGRARKRRKALFCLVINNTIMSYPGSPPPPPWANITGISRTVMKDNAQETLVNYDGNARPGEIVADLTQDPPTLYIGNNAGQLTLISSGGNGGYGNTQVGQYLNAGLVGNIIPSGNATYSLGNSTNWWSNVWVASNTIYIGGVPIGITGNILTVNGQEVVNNGGNTNISTTGNITAANLGNVSSINLNGNASTVLSGNGAWISSSNYGNSNVASYLPINTSNISGNNFTASGNIRVGSLGGQEQLLFYSTTPTTVIFDLMGNFPQPFFAGQTILVSGIEAGGPVELNGYWTVTAADVNTVTISCNLQPTLPFTSLVFGQVVNVKSISATGNISGSYISAAGNITGSYISANGPVSLPVYANATVRDATITSPQPGMIIYVTGTGMQVRGATSWNTVTGSGT